METFALPEKKRKRYASGREYSGQIVGRRAIAERTSSFERRIKTEFVDHAVESEGLESTFYLADPFAS